jgi:large subunit ribosomal protein L28
MAKLLSLEISGKQEVGRELEFVLQELGREVNTMGSKVDSSVVAQLVVETKVILEKMREQSLNLE